MFSEVRHAGETLVDPTATVEELKDVLTNLMLAVSARYVEISDLVDQYVPIDA